MSKYRKYFFKTIRTMYPGRSSHVIAVTEKNYTEMAADISFAKHSPNPIDRRLDFCAYFLALIKTLDQSGEEYNSIRRTCLTIVTEYVRPKNWFHQQLKKVFPKMTNTKLGQWLIKKFHQRVSSNPDPRGFVANIITDKDETFGLQYGVDIIECGICKLYQRHGFEKYVPILCEVDEITSSLAGLKLVRHGTIALGAQKCDFRFKRM